MLRGLMGPPYSRPAAILIGPTALAEMTRPSLAHAFEILAGDAGLEPLGQDRSSPEQTLVLAEPQDFSREDALALLERASARRLRLYAPAPGDQEPLRPWDLADLIGPQQVMTAGRRPGEGPLRERRILVTGAGGSIGSVLTRRLAQHYPAWLGLLDYSEYNLFRISRSTAASRGQTPYASFLADVRDGEALRRLFEREKPDLIFHAAALKHVPIVEEHPCEGALTNVGGVRNVLRAAAEIGADVIFVSTDKAVNPANVMGATKRLGELLCQGRDLLGGRRAISVRLGNVVGSAGSVAPVFEEQIAARGPVTVTHPAVSRYFITIPQAADFLVRAAADGLADPSLRGAVQVLEMGAPLKIVELARLMIRLQGLQPEVDVPIEFVGLRPGEKLIEQLVNADEEVIGRSGAGVSSVRAPVRELGALESEVDRLLLLARAGQDELVRSGLLRIVGATSPAAIAV